MHTYLLMLTLFSTIITKGYANVWCYECVSTQPGCGAPLNWLWHWTSICPEDNDVCVKIIERKDAEVVLTRSCLSRLQGYRTDIPADHYEGCRPAARDVKLGHYVNNSVKELDIHRDFYDETLWCFCFLDNWCNHSQWVVPSAILIVFGMLATFL